jgi:hypothetical protein
MDRCHKKAEFNFPELFYASLFCEPKDKLSLMQIRKVTERFMNQASSLCPTSKEYDDFNVERRARLGALDRVSFEVDDRLSCGWLLVFENDFSVKLSFFIQYEKRFVLMNDDVDLMHELRKDEILVTVQKFISVHEGVGFIEAKVDSHGMRWVVVNEMPPGSAVDYPDNVGTASRIVMSEPQFTALRDVMQDRVARSRDDMKKLQSVYCSVLRQIVAKTRENLRSDCFGCMRGAPGDAFICSRGDVRCIEMKLYMCLQKKRIANQRKCYEFVYENIAHIFPAAAKCLKEEMRQEEGLINKYPGGLPDHVQHCKPNEKQIPMSVVGPMDYDA